MVPSAIKLVVLFVCLGGGQNIKHAKIGIPNTKNKIKLEKNTHQHQNKKNDNIFPSLVCCQIGS